MDNGSADFYGDGQEAKALAPEWQKSRSDVFSLQLPAAPGGSGSTGGGGSTSPTPTTTTPTTPAQDAPAPSPTTTTTPSQAAPPAAEAPQATATAAQVAAAKRQADAQAGQPTTFLGQVGGALIFVPTATRGSFDLADFAPAHDGSDSFTVDVVQCQRDCRVTVTTVLTLDGTGARAAKTRAIALPTQKATLTAGKRVKVRIRLTRTQLAAIRKAGGARLTTKVTVRDASGTHTKTITRTIRAKRKKASAKH